MPPALPSPTPAAPMAALTPFASAIAPASAMRAIGPTAPTINRSPLTASPSLLATQITGRYRDGMHRAIDSITPYFVRLRRSAAPMEAEPVDFGGPSVSRAVLAPTAARAVLARGAARYTPCRLFPCRLLPCRVHLRRWSAGAVWMTRAVSSDAPPALPAAFTPVRRSILSGAPSISAGPSVFGGAVSAVSRSVESGGSQSVSRAALPFTVSSLSASRPVLRNALPLPASGGPVVQTRPSASAARAASVPVIAPARSSGAFAPASSSQAAPTRTVYRRATAGSDAGFAPANVAAPTAARSVSIADAPLARQVVPLLSRASAQGGPVSGVTSQSSVIPLAMAARSVAREPFAPLLSAARLTAPVAARNPMVGASVVPTAQRASTPDLPAPGRPSVPQALWRQVAPDAPSPIERGSGAGYTVSPSVLAADFAPVQNSFAARTAPIEAYRSPFAFVARRGDSTSSATNASSAAVFRATDDETASVPSGAETTAPETTMRTLSPFVPRSAAPLLSRAATMARAMALPATSAILSLSAAAFAQPSGIPQTGAAARRPALSAMPAPPTIISREPVVDRFASDTRTFVALPHFAPTVSRFAMGGAVGHASQASVSRQAAFPSTSAPLVAARAVSPVSIPLGLSRSAKNVYRAEETAAPNASESFVASANQSISEVTPGFVPRQFDDSITAANGGGAAFLSPIAARTVTPLGFISRIPLVRQTAAGTSHSASGSQPFLARQAALPASVASRSFAPASADATISRAFVPVTAFRAAASETASETVNEPINASVLRDFQIARVFATPVFSSTRNTPFAIDAPATVSRSGSSSPVSEAETANASFASDTASLSRQIARQSSGTEPRVTRGALPFTTIASRAALTTAPFVLRTPKIKQPEIGASRLRKPQFRSGYGSEAGGSPCGNALRFVAAGFARSGHERRN